MKDELKKAIAEQAYKENHENPFKLASGRLSAYYFNLKTVLLQPAFLETAARLMSELIKKKTGGAEAAGGLTMGADPLVYAISLISPGTLLPLVVRKEAKDHGSGRRVEGRLDMIGNRASVVLIDDVITTGKSTLQAYEALKAEGLEPAYAFCVVDRHEGGRENLAAAGVELCPLFTLEDFRKK